MNQLCKVCGEPAAGYHFGAFTCEGCKSFFGRTYSNLSALGECKNNGQCVINKKNRTSCKSCRLKKCLVVGMSKSGSRYGRRSNWFKIHCLIQDQAEKANSKLDDSGSTCTSGTSLNPGSSPGSIPSPSSMEQKSNFLASLHNNNNHSKHNPHHNNNNNNNHNNNHVGSSRSERNHHGLATSLIPSPLSSNQQHRSSHHQTSLSPLLPGAGLNPSSLSPLLPFNYPSRFFFQNYGSPAAAAAMSAALFRGIMSGSAAAMGPLSTSSPFSPTSLSAPSPVDLSSALLEASSKAKKSRINDSDDEDMMMKEEEDDEEDVDVDDDGEEDRNDVGINPKIGTHRKSLMNHHRSTNHRFNNSSSHGHHGNRRNNNGQESPSSDSITEGEEEVDKPLDLTLK